MCRPSFGDMNSPKSLLRIAEKACDFDRAHFADGNVPTTETLASHHLQLATDHKLITRLVPRYAVALGFFEGYVQAVDDCSTAIAEPVSADEIGTWISIGEATGKIPENGDGYIRDIVARNGWEYVALQPKKRIEQTNIGIVKKPPPPPPPAAPPKPEEISDELAQAAANYTNGIYFVGCTPDEVRKSLNVVVKTKWEQAVDGFIEGARWQLARTPSMLANEVQNWERAQYEKTIELMNARCNDLRSALSETENERSAMKEERDRVLAKVRAWEAQTGETNQRIVQEKLASGSPIEPTTSIVFRDENERDFWDEQVHALNRRCDRSAHDVANTADEMVEERRKRMPTLDAIDPKAITDELLLEGAEWANSFCDMASVPCDLASAKSAMNGNVVFELRWSNAVRSYVSGAIRKVRKT